jgi:hypothetical protein
MLHGSLMLPPDLFKQLAAQGGFLLQHVLSKKSDLAWRQHFRICVDAVLAATADHIAWPCQEDDLSAAVQMAHAERHKASLDNMHAVTTCFAMRQHLAGLIALRDEAERVALVRLPGLVGRDEGGWQHHALAPSCRVPVWTSGKDADKVSRFTATRQVGTSA